MLRLKKLTFRNIGRFVDEQTILIDSLGNINQVDGLNGLTGGSSGSGKTTVFHALDWLLGVCELPTSVLQSRLTKDHISVTGYFEWDGKEAIIQRARKLSVTINGVEFVGSSKISEEKLDEIIGIPRDLFKKLIHKSQGEGGFFLSMTPAQMNSFLTDCLGLASIRAKIDQVALKAKELTLDHTRYQSELEAVKAALKANKQALEAIGDEPKTDLMEETIANYARVRNEAEQALNALKSEYNDLRSSLERKTPQIDNLPFNRSKLIEFETKIKEIEQQINIFLNKERDRQAEVNKKISDVKLEYINDRSILKSEINQKLSKIQADSYKNISELSLHQNRIDNQIDLGNKSKQEATKIAGQIKILREGICHTCEQTWITQSAKNEEQKLLDKINKYKVDIEQGSKAQAELKDLEVAFKTVKDHELEECALLSNYQKIKESEITQKSANVMANLEQELKPRIPEEITVLKDQLAELDSLKAKELKKEAVYIEARDRANKAKMTSFLAEQKSLAETYRVMDEEANQRLNSARSIHETAVQALKHHKNDLQRYRIVLNNLNKGREEMNLKEDDITSNLVNTNQNLVLAEETEKCLKTYLSYSFDDSLDTISDTATRIIRNIPNMQNATIRLVGTKETGTGAVKNQINVLIDNDGEIDIPLKSLSGGERTSLDLAIDFAVLDLIEARSGAGANIYILDEPFSGLDSVNCESILGMLKSINTNKKIFIVDHNDIVKEMVDNHIMVIREGETSLIK